MLVAIYFFPLPFDHLSQCLESLDHWHFFNKYILSTIRTEYFVVISKTDLVWAALEFIISVEERDFKPVCQYLTNCNWGKLLREKVLSKFIVVARGLSKTQNYGQGLLPH